MFEDNESERSDTNRERPSSSDCFKLSGVVANIPPSQECSISIYHVHTVPRLQNIQDRNVHMNCKHFQGSNSHSAIWIFVFPDSQLNCDCYQTRNKSQCMSTNKPALSSELLSLSTLKGQATDTRNINSEWLGIEVMAFPWFPPSAIPRQNVQTKMN